MKTSYWYSRCLTDADAYSIRKKSKREVARLIREMPHHRWGPIVRVTIEGKSLFSIIEDILSEGGNSAESSTHYAAGGE